MTLKHLTPAVVAELETPGAVAPIAKASVVPAKPSAPVAPVTTPSLAEPVAATVAPQAGGAADGAKPVRMYRGRAY